MIPNIAFHFPSVINNSSLLYAKDTAIWKTTRFFYKYTEVLNENYDFNIQFYDIM